MQTTKMLPLNCSKDDRPICIPNKPYHRLPSIILVSKPLLQGHNMHRKSHMHKQRLYHNRSSKHCVSNLPSLQIYPTKNAYSRVFYFSEHEHILQLFYDYSSVAKSSGLCPKSHFIRSKSELVISLYIREGSTSTFTNVSIRCMATICAHR